MSDLECPYCHAENDLSNDEKMLFSESRLEQHQCYECEKIYIFSIYIPPPTYTAYLAECLNDGNHQWEILKSYPKERGLAKMRCKVCDETRRMSDKEWYEWISA